MQTELELSELVERLWWFTQLRWLAVAGIAAVAVLPAHIVGLAPQALPLLVVAALVAGYNLIFWLLARPSDMWKVEGRLAVAVANAQILLDLVALTVVLHLTGGVENPFYLLYRSIAVSTGAHRKTRRNRGSHGSNRRRAQFTRSGALRDHIEL